MKIEPMRHTFVCPGCDEPVDPTTGLLMHTPLGNGVIAWWHADCRNYVLGIDGVSLRKAVLGVEEEKP